MFSKRQVFVGILMFFATTSNGADSKTAYKTGPIMGVVQENGGNSSLYYHSPDGSSKGEVGFKQSIMWGGIRLTSGKRTPEIEGRKLIIGYAEVGVFTGRSDTDHIIYSINESGLFVGFGMKVKFLNIGFRYFNSNGTYSGRYNSTEFSGDCRFNRCMGELRIDHFISPVISFGSRQFVPKGGHGEYSAGNITAGLGEESSFTWMIGFEFDVVKAFGPN